MLRFNFQTPRTVGSLKTTTFVSGSRRVCFQHCRCSLSVSGLQLKMLAEDLPAKCYVDKAVQTDSSQLVIPDKHQTMEDLDKDAGPVAGQSKEEGVYRAESAKSDALGSPGSFLEKLDDLEDAEGTSMAPTTRAYSNDLSYRTLKLPSARIVSLPETLSLYSARRSLLESVAGRVVSNPERSRAQRQDSSQSSDCLDISAETDQLVCGTQVRTRARARITAMDAPYTPSPPSSPDSVVIIADKSQLPRGFLRNKVTLESPVLALRPDEKGAGGIIYASIYAHTHSDRVDHMDQVPS